MSASILSVIYSIFFMLVTKMTSVFCQASCRFSDLSQLLILAKVVTHVASIEMQFLRDNCYCYIVSITNYLHIPWYWKEGAALHRRVIFHSSGPSTEPCGTLSVISYFLTPSSVSQSKKSCVCLKRNSL